MKHKCTCSSCELDIKVSNVYPFILLFLHLFFLSFIYSFFLSLFQCRDRGSSDRFRQILSQAADRWHIGRTYLPSYSESQASQLLQDQTVQVHPNIPTVSAWSAKNGNNEFPLNGKIFYFMHDYIWCVHYCQAIVNTSINFYSGTWTLESMTL